MSFIWNAYLGTVQILCARWSELRRVWLAGVHVNMSTALTDRGKASVRRLASAQFGVYRSSASSSAARLFLTNQQVQTDHRHVYIRACYRKNPSSRAHQKNHTNLHRCLRTGETTPANTLKGHRRQGPPPRSPGLHGRQAAAQRPEDRRCAMRGPEHLRRVLPREAYVPPIHRSVPAKGRAHGVV